MKVEDTGIPEPTAEESFRARVRFYRHLDKPSEETLTRESFVAAAEALAMGFFPSNGGSVRRIHVSDETPNDMDGYVFKVTIS